jgi:hypothetical protein
MKNYSRRFAAFWILVGAFLGVSIPLYAHHGSAAYEMRSSVSVKGAVTDFKFVNPHVLVYVDAKNAQGEVEKWQAELTSPNRLARAGWNLHTLKLGDEITLVGAPAKSGVHSLWITKILGTDGKPMNVTIGD